MDKHYLNPLFCPESVVVFAGQHEGKGTQTAAAHTLHQALRAQRFDGTMQFLDIGTTGTLGDLAQTRADLAIIALPHGEVPAALEVAGRIACRAARAHPLIAAAQCSTMKLGFCEGRDPQNRR